MIRYLVAGIASQYGDCHTTTSVWILDFIWVNSDCLKQFIENLEEHHLCTHGTMNHHDRHGSVKQPNERFPSEMGWQDRS